MERQINLSNFNEKYLISSSSNETASEGGIEELNLDDEPYPSQDLEDIETNSEFTRLSSVSLIDLDQLEDQSDIQINYLNLNFNNFARSTQDNQLTKSLSSNRHSHVQVSLFQHTDFTQNSINRVTSPTKSLRIWKGKKYSVQKFKKKVYENIHKIEKIITSRVILAVKLR